MYGTAENIMHTSKTTVTCSTACLMILCTVDAYPGYRQSYTPYTRIKFM